MNNLKEKHLHKGWAKVMDEMNGDYINSPQSSIRGKIIDYLSDFIQKNNIPAKVIRRTWNTDYINDEIQFVSIKRNWYWFSVIPLFIRLKMISFDNDTRYILRDGLELTISDSYYNLFVNYIRKNPLKINKKPIKIILQRETK